MKTTSFQLIGLTCPACVKLVEKRLEKIKGAVDIKIELDGQSEISADTEITIDEIKSALADTEFKVA